MVHSLLQHVHPPFIRALIADTFSAFNAALILYLSLSSRIGRASDTENDDIFRLARFLQQSWKAMITLGDENIAIVRRIANTIRNLIDMCVKLGE